MASIIDRASAPEAPFPWAPKPPDFRFSTDDFPEADRVAIFREVVGRQMLRQEIEPLADHPFQVHGTARPLPGGLFAVWSTCTPHNLQRTRRLLSDGDDSLLFQWTTTARLAEHLGREMILEPGDAVLFSCAEPRRAAMRSSFKTITIKAPRNMLGPLLLAPDSCIGRPVPASSDALRLLLRYLEVLREESATMSRAVQDLAVAHVCDLLAVAFGATRDAADSAGRRGVRAGRLLTIKRDIEASLADTELSVADVAARHCMTPRSLQMLFEESGTTFTQFLREQRLARAHRMLRSRRFDAERIIDIALAVGFADISYFNRAFRARYGATPSDVRVSNV